MSELIEFLIRQPLILIFLAIWLLSGLGKLGQKAAKRVAEQQAARRREESEHRRHPLCGALARGVIPHTYHSCHAIMMEYLCSSYRDLENSGKNTYNVPSGNNINL